MSNNGNTQLFQKQVWAYYTDHGRHDLPWRNPEPNGSFDAYKILVSELMLQQTQVTRIIPKFHQFLDVFPSLELLAAAPLSAVLIAWSGLGYNRRAKFLQQAAQLIVRDFGGAFPTTMSQLVTLPGVGSNTAGAVLAYAFNEPVAFVETNIRTVFIHHFFKDQAAVSDKDIRELVIKTLDTTNPRVWYWALMDYGSFLKKSVGNTSIASKSYAKQPAFGSSRRQIRGHVLRLLAQGPQTVAALGAAIADERLQAVLTDLVHEGLIQKDGSIYQLGS